MATIVQNYGPIYGEVVNGTVQGRPNGSVYVPISNTIEIRTVAEKIRYTSGTWRFNVDALIEIIAESQDLANNIQTQVYSDAELTTLVASRNFTAGEFNKSLWGTAFAYGAVEGIQDDDVFYVRAQLMNNGTPVATSSSVSIAVVVTP